MKERFAHFYKPTEEEIKNLWANSHFVFDSNTLLNLYMYTNETVEDYWKVFEKIESHIWLSYHSGYEFHKNRPSRIRTQQILFEQTIKSLQNISESSKEKIRETFNNTREHPSIEEDVIVQKVEKFYDSLISEIKEKQNNYPDLLTEQDHILEKVSELFDGNIGEKLSEKELEKIYEEGKERYKKKIPPGFEDANKDGTNKYGDLVIWSEVLKFAQNSFVDSIIFVTNDLKKDWWKISKGRTIGPHPKLRKEFKDKTDKKYYQYNSEQFLKHAKSFIIDINEESISETKRVSDRISRSESIQEVINRVKMNFSELSRNLPQGKIDRIAGMTNLSQTAREVLRNQVANEVNPLNNLSQEEIDRITGMTSLSQTARELMRNLPKSSGSSEEE